MALAVRTSTLDRLAPAEADAVRRLVADAAAVDGSSALNEAALLALDHPGSTRHVLALPDEDPTDSSGAPLRGYAQLDPGPSASTGQLVVHPDQRRQHVGRALLGELLALAPSRLQVWAVGDRPAARALAARVGLVAARELVVMTRPLDDRLRVPELPAGTTVRTFEPGRDEAAWLAVNARAFATHPEQGSITAEDLALRMAEPWFDPRGFFLAERAGTLVGFHWTKRHAGTLGEVYVLGVDPDAGGRGLGKALLDVGLRHLRAAGCTEVELYVEGDHPRAIGLYAGRGFRPATRDVMYAQP